MSLLGAYTKQPIEVEYYSIQYSKDLTSTDQLQSAWQIFAPDMADSWDEVVQATPYTATLTDAGKVIVSTSGITLPDGAPDGYRLYVSNKSQSTGISVGSFNVPARGATIVLRKAGAWVEEAKTELTLVDIAQDHRVRTRVFKGALYETYKIQITVDTAEGRTLQDEFTVTIEES